MSFIFRKNKLRTILACIIFAIGSCIALYLVRTFDGTVGRTLWLVLAMCVLLSYSSRVLIDMYMRFEGRLRRYSLRVHLASSNTILSHEYQKLGFQNKKFGQYSLIIRKSAVPLVIKILPGVWKESLEQRQRFRKLSDLIRVWLYQHKIGKVSLGRIMTGEDQFNFTYGIIAIEKDSLVLQKTDTMSALVDQQVMGRELVLFGNAIATSSVLLREEGNFYLLDRAQESGLKQPINLLMLFMTPAGDVVLDEKFKRYFPAYYTATSTEHLDQFCLEQAHAHVNMPVSGCKVMGYGLVVSDVGALTIVCLVELDDVELPTVPFTTWKEAPAEDEIEALLRYYAVR